MVCGGCVVLWSVAVSGVVKVNESCITCISVSVLLDTNMQLFTFTSETTN